MRKFYFGILALAALAACSKEEPIATSQGEEITFSTFVGKATRADEAADPSYNGTTAKLTEFRLWGTVQGAGDGMALVDIYKDDTVKGTVVGENSVWNCTTKTNYWIPTAKYNFAAIANADVNVEGETSNSVVTLGEDLLPETVTFTADGITDLIYARPAEITADENSDKVAFTFDHLLSKVKFTVNNTSYIDANNYAEGYSYVVKNIIINGLTKGTCTLADNTWSDTVAGATVLKGEGTDDYADAIVVADNDDKEVCVSEKLVIPTDVTVSFKLVRLVGGKEISIKSYITESHTLVAGHAYNFAVSVSAGNEIKFSVAAINAWVIDDTDPNTEGVQDEKTLSYSEVTNQNN